MVGAPVDCSISVGDLRPAPAVVATRDDAFADVANADRRRDTETGALAAPAEPIRSVVSGAGVQEEVTPGPARAVPAGAVPLCADIPDALRPVAPNADQTSLGNGEVSATGSRTAARIEDRANSLETPTGLPTENGWLDEAGPRAEESHVVPPRGAASSRVAQGGVRDDHATTSRPSKDESIDVASGRYCTIERAAGILDTTPAALRAQLQRFVNKAGLPAGGIELGGGIVARKFGARSWRVWIPHS